MSEFQRSIGLWIAGISLIIMVLLFILKETELGFYFIFGVVIGAVISTTG